MDEHVPLTRRYYNPYNETPNQGEAMQFIPQSKTDIVKGAVGFVVGSGVSVIVRGVIKNNTSTDGVIEKVTLAVATVVVGMMAREATKEYTDGLIDRTIESWNEFKNELNTFRSDSTD